MQFSVIDFCCSVPAVPAVCPGGERAGGSGRLAPYADDGDLDYIPDYFVTVDLREDGSADIVYDITWQVIGGDQTDYLSWVKIGLPNAYAEDLTPADRHHLRFAVHRRQRQLRQGRVCTAVLLARGGRPKRR